MSPLLEEFLPLLRILASEAASDGFSATINTDFITLHLQITYKIENIEFMLNLLTIFNIIF